MLVIQRPTVEAIGEEEGNRQRFAISPLEPGFGHTLGNSLRRTLLSSIPGAAVTQVRFDDALHEFDTIEGVTEDVTDIILNLKDLVLRVPQRRAGHAAPRRARPGRRHRRRHPAARATSRSSTPTCTSPRSTAGPPRHRHHRVARAAATCRPTRNKSSATIGVIPVDSIFSPVRRVAFEVEPTRVEQSTDYDRLVLDIETDGSITPREALASAGATLRSLVELVAEMSDEPQGLELGEVGDGHRRLARPRPADRGPRPLRASPQLPQAGPGQHDRRAAAEDRGRPAGHHQLRPEVARRGDRRSSTSAACRCARRTRTGRVVTPCLPPRRRAAASAATPPPAADDGQPRRVARRRRGASSPPRPRPRRCARSPRRSSPRPRRAALHQPPPGRRRTSATRR